MGNRLLKLIQDVSLRMRLYRDVQRSRANAEELSDRELLILRLLSERERMSVSEVAAAFNEVALHTVGESTISTTISRLWNEKGCVSKKIDPRNQRVTTVRLTDKGRKALKAEQESQLERFKALIHAIDLTEQQQDLMENILDKAVSYFDHLLEEAATRKSSEK